MKIDFSAPELKNILKSFYNITGLRIGISDTNRNEIVCYPDSSCSFCGIVKANPLAAERCDRCDEAAFEKAKTMGDVYLYECHAGLTEACCKLVYQNQIIGYIMIGQFATAETTPDHIRSKCTPIFQDMARLLTGFDTVKKIDKEFIDSSITILKVCIQHIYMKGILKLQDSLASRLEDYITNHITQKLVADQIAKALHTNRTTVFSCAKNHFGYTLAQFIEHKRLELAAELLKNSQKSVTEISEVCGFTDPNYFSRRFKKQFHQSPNKYRYSVHRQTTGTVQVF